MSDGQQEAACDVCVQLNLCLETETTPGGITLDNVGAVLTCESPASVTATWMQYWNIRLQLLHCKTVPWKRNRANTTMNYHHHHLTVYIFSCFPFVLIKTGVFLSFFSLSCNQNEFNLIKIRKKKKEDLVFLRRHASLSLRYDQKNSIPSPLALSGRLTTYFSDTVVSTLIKTNFFFKKHPMTLERIENFELSVRTVNLD